MSPKRDDVAILAVISLGFDSPAQLNREPNGLLFRVRAGD